MAATAYLFLLTVSFASGTFFKLDVNGSPSKIELELSHHGGGLHVSHQRTYHHVRYPKIAISPQTFLEKCHLRHPSAFLCYLELQNIYRRIRGDPAPITDRNSLKANTRNLIPESLKEKNKQIDKPESYINSILDEDKRNASSFNASDSALNSTWIEIKDPRKTAPVESEIADEKEADEFMSLGKENVVMGENTNISNSDETGNKTNSTATDGSNTDGETATGIQHTTTIPETSGKKDERTTVAGESSDVTLTVGVTGGKTTANQDPINTVETDEEDKGNTNVQKKTTGVSLAEIAGKSTTTNLLTDSAKFGFKITTENITGNETDAEVTTDKGTGDMSSSTEHTISTESRTTLTTVLPEVLTNDTTLGTDDSIESTVFITTLPTDPTRSQTVSVSDADIISPSSETEPAKSSPTTVFPSVSVTESTGYTTESSDGGFTSTMFYVTKPIPVVPEHNINIRSIKVTKIVLSVLLLVTGLIAVVMLAVYMFRVRRGAVQYDQLTLLP